MQVFLIMEWLDAAFECDLVPEQSKDSLGSFEALKGCVTLNSQRMSNRPFSFGHSLQPWTRTGERSPRASSMEEGRTFEPAPRLLARDLRLQIILIIWPGGGVGRAGPSTAFGLKVRLCLCRLNPLSYWRLVV